MCGRYVSISTPEQLAEHFDVDEVRTQALGERYNVAPTLDVYSVIERDDERRLGTLRWGFVPFWSDGPKKGPSPINARVETVHESRMFADAFERRRCLVPADGFYEWQDREGRKKQPFYFHHPDDEPLAFAGIWSSWRPQADDHDGDTPPEPLYSCAILTTAARGAIAEVHDRMPVILPERLWEAWLDEEETDAAQLQEAVASLGVPDLAAYRISDRVNNVRNDGPQLLEPGEVE
ncbi:MAG: SOS response-associated peptidase [Nitriliruptorales bacterium]|nr:SOS response-associated peptidase [Nitriliruptorales bacterium]